MSTFDDLMGEVMATADRFGHREHVKLTWLAVRRCGTTAAVELISDGIQRTARYAGVPQKYNSTVSRAWVELTAYHISEVPGESFDELLQRNPGLLDKRLLTRFYHSRTLASPAARRGWVEPDLHAFPR
jgi:CRP-like cAMP-binding protein